MIHKTILLLAATALSVVWAGFQSNARAEEPTQLDKLIGDVRGVGPLGEGNRAASEAAQALAHTPARELPAILSAMNGANPLAQNWLRLIVESVADRHQEGGKKLPVASLKDFLASHDNSPRARRLAYELIQREEPKAIETYAAKFLNDPSLELRRDAIEYLTAQAVVDGKPDLKRHRELLGAARDLDQIEGLTKTLRDAGEEVNLPQHFGFLMDWHLVGPFNNRDKSGFDVAYAPEKAIDLSAEYSGMDDAKIKWSKHTTEDEYGLVNLNEVLGKHKGAITYAYTEFDAADAQDVELRLGCINANKIWLNGELLTRNNVYHANTFIDQYVGTGKLKKGRNTILLKVAQNEQEESWAQRWQFQLRVCDQYGTAVHGAH